MQELLDQLTAPAYDNTTLHRQAYRSISACTAVVASASGQQNRCRNLAKKLSEQIVSNDTADGVRLFSLLAIGELGCTCPRTFDEFSPKYIFIFSKWNLTISIFVICFFF